MSKFIAIDSGKYATKACLRDSGKQSEKIKFRTKMDETEEEVANGKNDCVLTYDGKKYLIGDEAETIDYEKSKEKDIHKLSTYAAIAKLANDGDTIGVAIGCPLSIFHNKEARNKYRDFMITTGETIIEINGVKKHINIDKVFVFAEGSGLLYKNPKLYENRTIGIIDIGGLNSNNCIYQNLLPVKSTAFTTNLGSNILRNDLKILLNSKFPDVNLQDWQMEEIIKKGFIKSKKEESKKIISEFLQKHVNKILNECIRKGWDLKNIDLFFVGGGSTLLETEIKNIISDAEISKDAEWDNAEGFSVFGEIKYEP